MRFHWTIALILFLPCLLSAQPADFANVKSISSSYDSLVYSNYYDGKSLWGYMDGGADLYLEYGFEGVLVQEIISGGIQLKCEFFKMKDPASAFGIFSVQRHNCSSTTSLEDFHCLNKYQVQLVRGSYYISLINSVGSEAAQQLSIDLAAKLSKTIRKADISLPKILPFSGQEPNIVFLKGKISLGNVYPRALDYLEEIPDFTLWLLPSTDKKVPDYALIDFKSQDDLQKYFELAFHGKASAEIFQTPLKKGMRMAKKVDRYTILQAEGTMNKDSKKMFEMAVNKKEE